MSQAMTSEHLIRSIKKRAQIPTNQVTFTDLDFLEFADEEMLIGLVPSILQLHEDYYLFQEDIPLEPNKSNYPIPTRAMGSKLRDVSFVDTSGGVFKMVRLLVEDEVGFNRTNNAGTSGLRYYFLKNNEVQLMTGISSNVNGYLRFSYYMRPNQLVLDNRAGLITNFNTLTGLVTIDTFPDHFDTSIQYDFLMGGSFFKVIDYDIDASSISDTGLKLAITEEVDFTGDTTNTLTTITNLSSTTSLGVGQTVSGTGIPANTTILSIDSATQITLSNAATVTSTVTITSLVGILPENLAVGDYIMQAGETIVPNIPTELHSVLAQRVACVCLEALGDTQGLTNASARLEKMEVALGVLIDNRVEGSPQKVVNKNSMMRTPYYWRRW